MDYGINWRDTVLHMKWCYRLVTIIYSIPDTNKDKDQFVSEVTEYK